MHWHNSIEQVVLMMGILRAGLVVVPINPRLKATEIDYVLEHSGARLCFCEPELAGLVNRVEVMSELPAFKRSCEPLADVDPDAPASSSTPRAPRRDRKGPSIPSGAYTKVRVCCGTPWRV